MRGTAAPRVPGHAIEDFLPAVADALRASRASRCEHGFLVYAPSEAGAPLVAEESSVGGREEIRWRWSEPDATVAFSFHTHPGADSLCIPSGVDLVGALVRGDHVVYVLTTDGRLSGWRFRASSEHPRAVIDAMHALDDARRFGTPFLRFLYDAFEALRPKLVEPAYAARLRVDDAGGHHLAREEPGRAFFSASERARTGL